MPLVLTPIHQDQLVNACALRVVDIDVAALLPCQVPSQAATDMSASLTTGLSVSARTRLAPPH